MEFKVKENPTKADDIPPLQQIKDKRYYEKFERDTKKIFLTGITFSKEGRKKYCFIRIRENLRGGRGISPVIPRHLSVEVNIQQKSDLILIAFL